MGAVPPDEAVHQPARDTAHQAARRPQTPSQVRNTTRGVTVMPTAEGPSLRSDPRWTRDAARRAERLLGRLIARRSRPAEQH
jgi:hypothetical protein